MDTNTSNIGLNKTTTQITLTYSQLDKIKEEISNESNPKNMIESMKLLNDSKLLQQTLQNASDNFKKQVGREMTYSEMREMMG